MKWNMVATWKMSMDGVKEGMKLLKEKGDIHKAVVEAIKNVEDNEKYSSVGYGGLPNEEGSVELDAAFMDGDTLDAGGVMAVRDIKNPIEAAFRLSKDSRNCFLAGEGAAKFARNHQLTFRDMLAPSAKLKYEDIMFHGRGKGELEAYKEYKEHDTVCVIGKDDEGGMVCGVSTSGLFLKHPGRIGDSPIIGSGFYVDSLAGGAAATGVGEDIMKGCLSYEIVTRMRRGQEVQAACQEALDNHISRLESRGRKAGSISVIAMDRNGEIGAATNLNVFPFTAGSSSGKCEIFAAVRCGGEIRVVPAEEVEWGEYVGD